MGSPGAWRLGPRVPGAQGVDIATYHLGGDGPPVILAHASGFHGRCWIPLAAPLAAEFTVWAVDFRGHGSSGKSPDRRYDDWHLFAEDLLAVLGVLAPGEPWRGLGHSLGGAVLLMSELRRPGSFASLCTYEPVVPPPVPLWDHNDEMPLTTVARKRRRTFPSKEAARRNYAAKDPFARFLPEVLDAYVDFGFVDTPNGVALACSPDDEASVYEGGGRHGTWGRLAEVRAPVAVLGGKDHAQLPARLVEDVARRLPRGGARRFERLTHFGPFEDPVLVGKIAAAAFGGEGRRSTIAVSAPR
jgi:pimeloyl-ACP methyl ester carboxylesterase